MTSNQILTLILAVLSGSGIAVIAEAIRRHVLCTRFAEDLHRADRRSYRPGG